jgi:hypothetical protein
MVDGNNAKGEAIVAWKEKNSTPDTTLWKMDSAISISMWVNPDMVSARAANPLLVKTNSFQLELNAKKLLGVVYDPAFRYTEGTTDFSATAGWYHCVMTYDKNIDSGAIDIYVNGVKEGTSGTATTITTNTSAIMIGSDGTTNYFNGQIDDVRIFNRKLTPSEIKWLYAGGDVNWVDLWCLASNWLDSCGDCNGADFDGDGNVDLYDFAVMGANWLK